MSCAVGVYLSSLAAHLPAEQEQEEDDDGTGNASPCDGCGQRPCRTCLLGRFRRGQHHEASHGGGG